MFNSDVYRKFSIPQIEYLIKAKINHLEQIPEDILSQIDSSFFEGTIIYKYNYFPESVKNRIGKKIFSLVNTASLSSIIFSIPDKVFRSLSSDEKHVLFKTMISSKAHDFLIKIWLVVQTEEEAKLVFPLLPQINDVPERFKNSYIQYLESKQKVELPEFYDAEKLKKNFDGFYEQHPESLDAKYADQHSLDFNIETDDHEIHGILNELDEGYKTDESTLKINYAATKLLNKVTPLDQEAFNESDNDSWKDIDERKIAWGLNEVKNHTQVLFHTLGITHLPVARYKLLSFDKIDSRLSPDVAEAVKEAIAVGRPFLLTFNDQPLMTRSLSSFSFDPLAIYEAFGTPGQPNVLSIKEFVNAPIEKVLAVEGSLMLNGQEGEREAILIDSYGLPCTLVIYYSFDEDEDKYHHKVLKEIGRAKYFNKKHVDNHFVKSGP
jgi:hypothetical protein